MSIACIFGLAGTSLNGEEAAFFRDVRPWGFILFSRNIESPGQMQKVTLSLREVLGRADTPVLIDQEGGRVQRMGPPHWRRFPPARAYGELAAGGPQNRLELAWLGARLLAHDLAGVGVNVDCLPVLDVPAPGAHDVIGDRAYATDAHEVACLGRAAAEGLMAGGVLPVIKHIPGHGRAGADSHHDLPVVEATYADLEGRDFLPFRELRDMPMAMTAHVVYAAIDGRAPGSNSRRVIGQVIRGAIGFDGLLMSDDLSMKALSGDLAERTRHSLAAGCDVVLHCNGDMAEMEAVSRAAGRLTGEAERRAAAALARLPAAPEAFDVRGARARFDAAFAGRWAA